MADTYGKIWRMVRNHCPLAPPSLVQYWVQQAWQDVNDERAWSHLRAESEMLINDAKTGTCNVTRRSATVSGGTLAYASTDVDRQFRVANNSPVYTIIAATAGGYTLDRPFGDTTQTGASASVGDWYFTCPADFQRFDAVLDTHNNWQMHLWVTGEELNTWDASRSASGTPWAVVSRRYGTTTATLNRPQYEIWPYPMSQVNYPFFYIKVTPILQDTDALPGVLSNSSNLLVELALANASEWPGLDDRRNPYFNLALAQSKRKFALDQVARLQVQDEEIYLTWLETVSWVNRYPYAPLDSRYLQGHDTPLTGWAWPH